MTPYVSVYENKSNNQQFFIEIDLPTHTFHIVGQETANKLFINMA